MDFLHRPPASSHSSLTKTAICLCLGLLVSGCAPGLALRKDAAPPTTNPMLNADYSDDADVPFIQETKTAMQGRYRLANFESERASRRTRDMANWVVSSKDNLNMPFAIVDKVNAEVYVFDVDGQLRGAAPVLLGLGQGDQIAPGLAGKPMSLIPPSQRTTPAGRFEAAMGLNLHGKEILWLDYGNSISLHPVVTSRPKERRLQRLETPTPLDNRISFGCINVPAKFFEDVVHEMFSGKVGIVYVLPEDRPVKES